MPVKFVEQSSPDFFEFRYIDRFTVDTPASSIRIISDLSMLERRYRLTGVEVPKVALRELILLFLLALAWCTVVAGRSRVLLERGPDCLTEEVHTFLVGRSKFAIE
ncbi:hypothetical protein C497_06559 [Halalkalicoccus jeotgali B3]|uniref:Uncharacterized protein n=1 Tax=Halalkalicoccus jeotgali (strain DSM 18796 / CECT 7217 / JCM 14584 / KCTC 4019 / B3) TaxID=795797 RepID=D8JCA7_HALJB|nr:hypothetical protein HacjB3_18358 [Halalkalicoccus jeotgali B3]ELY38823.1 hypothetical protein C497_06559 [Halalkalicoccus jeotgali B3]